MVRRTVNAFIHPDDVYHGEYVCRECSQCVHAYPTLHKRGRFHENVAARMKKFSAAQRAFPFFLRRGVHFIIRIQNGEKRGRIHVYAHPAKSSDRYPS
jgi:hypothetical protein